MVIGYIRYAWMPWQANYLGKRKKTLIQIAVSSVQLTGLHKSLLSAVNY
jgi:hypothetical protein